jgi:hypothetical protein
VQLEKGSTATSFDYRPYTTELQLCQRYYAKFSVPNSTSQAVGVGYQMSATTTSQIIVFTKVTMRASPTLGFASLQVTDNTSWSGTVSSISGQYGAPDACEMQVTHGTGGASFRPCSLSALSSSSYLDMSAEL